MASETYRLIKILFLDFKEVMFEQKLPAERYF